MELSVGVEREPTSRFCNYGKFSFLTKLGPFPVWPRFVFYMTFLSGVGGFVVNEKQEVLVIQEKTGPAARPGFWKVPGSATSFDSFSLLPGGIVDEGEYIHEAAVREVQEETGVKTEFVSMIAMRQMPRARLEKMDLYFLCLMKPLTNEIVLQEEEVADAKWMPVRLLPFK